MRRLRSKASPEQPEATKESESGGLALQWGMTEDVDDRPDAPEPLHPLHALAVLLELGIVGTFIVDRSWCGIALCLAYAWFSACVNVLRSSR